jgi:hypothetical protein
MQMNSNGQIRSEVECNDCGESFWAIHPPSMGAIRCHHCQSKNTTRYLFTTPKALCDDHQPASRWDYH